LIDLVAQPALGEMNRWRLLPDAGNFVQAGQFERFEMVGVFGEKVRILRLELLIRRQISAGSNND
jgi:hypothetical protein